MANLNIVETVEELYQYMVNELNKAYEEIHEAEMLMRTWYMGKDFPKDNRRAQKIYIKADKKIGKLHHEISIEYQTLVKLAMNFHSANGEGFDQNKIIKRIEALKMEAEILKSFIPYATAQVKLQESESE